MEEERSRLAAATMSAMVSLATDAARANQLDSAVEWWRQLTTLEPLSGRFAIGYLKALAARGDRAEALAFARQHEQVMRRELEVDPDPEVRRLEAELRAMPTRQVSLLAAPDAVHPVRQDSNGSLVVPAPAAPGAYAAPNAAARQRRRVPQPALALIGAAAMLLLIVTVAYARQRGWLRPASATPTLAVGLIREASGDSASDARVMTDMLATNLARVNGLRVLANSRLLELMRPGQDSGARYAGAFCAARRQCRAPSVPCAFSALRC